VRRALPAILLLAVACSSSGTDGGEQSKEVTRADFGDAWPLLVDGGTLECKGSDGTGAVTFRTGGTTYAVNGLAKSQGARDIDKIWAPNPSIPGAKKNIGPLIDEGLRLCR
jgi:hypothetical protein